MLRPVAAIACSKAAHALARPFQRLVGHAQERTLHRLPTFEFSEEQTRIAREDVEGFLARTGAALWIQHELAAHRKLKKAPEYYD